MFATQETAICADVACWELFEEGEEWVLVGGGCEMGWTPSGLILLSQDTAMMESCIVKKHKVRQVNLSCCADTRKNDLPEHSHLCHCPFAETCSGNALHLQAAWEGSCSAAEPERCPAGDQTNFQAEISQRRITCFASFQACLGACEQDHEQRELAVFAQLEQLLFSEGRHRCSRPAQH